MFTGIVKEVGIVYKIIDNTEGRRMFVYSEKLSQNMQVDDSISIDGVCQTVVGIEKNIFEIQCVHITLEKTTFKIFEEGTKVNLELPLKFNEPLGGHLVQGHINGVCVVDSIKKMGKNIEVSFEVVSKLSRYMIEEGSIAINGVSLTIAKINSNRNIFSVSIIPHTFDVTNFSELKVGTSVNVEVDMIAKYIENFLFFKQDNI